MTGTVPLELTHLIDRLHADFDNLLPKSASPELVQAEKNFFSRALAAFAVDKLAGCTLIESAAAIVDGGGDFGLDAIYFSQTSSALWLIQSKFDRDGTGQADLGGVSKFCDGKHFRSVFNSATDCALLKGALMAAINTPHSSGPNSTTPHVNS